jgi:hypothetical protein
VRRLDAGKATSMATMLKARRIQCEIGFLLYPSIVMCFKLRILSHNEFEGFDDPSSIVVSDNNQGTWET